MNLMGRLRAIERRAELTGPCPRCGKLGPPAKIIRIVYRSEEQTEGGAES